MKHGLIFLTLGALLAWRSMALGGWWLLLLWAAISFLLVGLAYLSLGSRSFGKRVDGRIAWWALIALLPYLLFTWTVWHVRRLVRAGAAAHEIVPGLWLGRRPLPSEVPQSVGWIVDLTAEFPLNRGLRRRGVNYRCLPTLDASVTDDAAFRDLVESIARSDRPVYVHCAVGYGRSASVVAAVLIARGIVPNVEVAEQYIRRIRRGVRLHPRQREQVQRLFRSMNPD